MDKFKKKLKSKIFRSTANESKSRRDPKLRHSNSMPFGPSFDISEEVLEEYVDLGYDPPSTSRYPAWPSSHDPNDFTRPYKPRSHTHRILNQLPTPPSAISQQPAVIQIPITISNPPPGAHAVLVTPERPPRPPTQDFSGIPTEDLLPQFPPELMDNIEAFNEQDRCQKYQESARAARNAAVLRSQQAQVVQRSASSASQYRTPPLKINHPPVFDTAVPYSKSSNRMYKNYDASQSMRSLADPHPHTPARYRACLTSSRTATGDSFGTHSASSSASGMYTNASATKSSHNPRDHANLAASDSSDAIPLVDDFASVRRRNASSSSSRSTLAMRRNGLMPPPPVPARASDEMPRVLRGPHASKLQISPPHMTDHETGMVVNDTNSEWGINCSNGSGAATVAGYERGAYAHCR
ncbi:hypothetical protein C0991_004515 [Blastosporella zonata]|nr:hypothetical protein C0991_004515 [Blastosporella zonata]